MMFQAYNSLRKPKVMAQPGTRAAKAAAAALRKEG